MAQDRRDVQASPDGAEPDMIRDAPLESEAAEHDDADGHLPDAEQDTDLDGDWRGGGLGGLFGPRYDDEPVGAANVPGTEVVEATAILPPADGLGPDGSDGTGGTGGTDGTDGTDGVAPAAGYEAAVTRQAAPGRPAHARTGVLRPARRTGGSYRGFGRYSVEGWQRRDPVGGEAGEPIPADALFPVRRRTPSRGWRRTIYRASGGLVRVPASSAEIRRREMISRARTPVTSGHYRVAVLSLKGGVGKTVTTVALGSTLASLRGDRVIAIDASPGRGTLADKLATPAKTTVRDLLDSREQVGRYADMRQFTGQNASRLEVLASEQDAEVSSALSGEDYDNICAVIERYYSVCLTDCGTGLIYPAMSSILRLADQVVLVSSASVDGARSASATMDWLAAHGHEDLVRNGVVALTAVRNWHRASVDPDVLQQHFAARCRAVTRIPYDPYLEQGAEIELDQLRRTTADAYLELAAIIGDRFDERKALR